MARKMKDSGIEWIGEIPEDWGIEKVKHLFFLGRGRVISQNELEDSGYPVYSSQTKDNGCLGYISTYDYDKSQLTWTTDGVNAGTVFLRQGKYNCTNVCGTLLPKNNEHNLLYLKYVLEYVAIYYKRADINGYKIMNNEMAQILVVLPSFDEQQRIADFLDQKCAQIDEILQKNRDTIAEYKKLKQSIITQAVTKGVRGERPMKDSGIEWIGEIPEEWEIARLKRDFSFGKGLPITKDNLIENGLAVISYGQIHSKHNTGVRIYNDLIRYVSNDYIKTNSSSLVHKGDFIFADTSEDLDGCGNCVYVDRQLQLFAGYHTIILFSKNDLCNKYLAYLFKTDQWRSQIRSRVSGVKLFSISRKILANATIIFPALDEQQEIALYLDEKCAEIDTLIEKKEQLVNELESYKKSLIYEYVTGKKEVIRNA